MSTGAAIYPSDANAHSGGKMTEEEKQRRLEALRRAKEQVKELRYVDDSIITDPRYVEALKSYDTNGDGVIDPQEILQIHKDMQSKKEQFELIKKIVVVVLVALILLLLVNGLLTAWIIRLTRQTDVDDDNNLTPKGQNSLVKTERPRYYTTLSDLTKLPASALNSLNRISFTTADGGVHNYEVQGVRMNAANETDAVIFFTNDRTLSLNSEGGVFSYFELDGSRIDTELVVDTDSPVSTNAKLQQRRMSMLRSYQDSGKLFDYNSLVERCSYTQDVCYHTYDEIMNLHTPMDEYGRRLQDTSNTARSPTYAEITADVAILTKDNRSGLQQARSFLENVLGKRVVDNKNGTVIIKFQIKERCSNYVTLRDYCKFYPAPMSDDQVDYKNFAPPFRGLQADNSLWWFTDEVEFAKDSYTIMLKVRYAHDIYRTRRLHVVLMDRTKPSHVVTYDEVQSLQDPRNPGITYDTMQTYIVNYKREEAINDDTLVMLAGTDTDKAREGPTRRLSSWDDAEYNFHMHIRSTKIYGFPSLFLSDALLDAEHAIHRAGTREEKSRRLAESDDALIDVQTTKDGAYPMVQFSDINASANGTVAISNVTAAKSQSLLPVASDVSDKPELTVSMPVATFTEPEIIYERGLIRWPNPKDVTTISEFALHLIPERNELALLKERQSASTNSTIGQLTSRRRLSDNLPEHHRRLFERAELRVEETFNRYAEHEQRIAKHFQDIDAELQKILDHLNIHQPIHRQLHEHITEGRQQVRTTRKTVNEFGLEVEEEVIEYFEHVPGGGRRLATSRVRPSRNSLQTTSNNFNNKKVPSSEYETKIRNMIRSNLVNIPRDPTTGDYNFGVSTNGYCANFYASWSNLYGHILFLYDTVDRLHTMAGTISTSISVSNNVERVLTIMENINNMMRPVTMVISKIPYIGPLFRGFAQIFDNTIRNVVAPPNGKLKSMNIKIREKRVKEKVDKFKDTAEQMMSALDAAGTVYHSYVVALVMLDNYCPRLRAGQANINNFDSTISSNVCLNLNNLLAPILAEFNALTAQINELLAGLGEIVRFLSQLLIFDVNIDMGLFNTIQSILNIISGFLNRRIDLCLPIDPCFWVQRVCTTVWYPCGIRWCGRWFKYPCGVRWCSYGFCFDIYIPYLCLRCWSFTIQQLIDGIMSVLSWVENIFNSIIDGLARALGISFPSINIPGLPSLGFLDNISAYLDSLFDFSLLDLNINWNVRLVNPLKGVLALLKSVILDIDINIAKLELGIPNLSLPTLLTLPKCDA